MPEKNLDKEREKKWKRKREKKANMIFDGGTVFKIIQRSSLCVYKLVKGLSSGSRLTQEEKRNCAIK